MLKKDKNVTLNFKETAFRWSFNDERKDRLMNGWNSEWMELAFFEWGIRFMNEKNKGYMYLAFWKVWN